MESLRLCAQRALRAGKGRLLTSTGSVLDGHLPVNVVIYLSMSLSFRLSTHLYSRVVIRPLTNRLRKFRAGFANAGGLGIKVRG